MIPRNLPKHVTESSPDGKDSVTRSWSLRVVEYHKESEVKDKENQNGIPFEGIILPTDITPHDILDLRNNLKLRSDDVFVVTFPKCGTSWMQQIVKLIWNSGKEDGRDIDEALPWIDPAKPSYAEVC